MGPPRPSSPPATCCNRPTAAAGACKCIAVVFVRQIKRLGRSAAHDGLVHHTVTAPPVASPPPAPPPPALCCVAATTAVGRGTTSILADAGDNHPGCRRCSPCSAPLWDRCWPGDVTLGLQWRSTPHRLCHRGSPAPSHRRPLNAGVGEYVAPIIPPDVPSHVLATTDAPGFTFKLLNCGDHLTWRRLVGFCKPPQLAPMVMTFPVTLSTVTNSNFPAPPESLPDKFFGSELVSICAPCASTHQQVAWVSAPRPCVRLSDRRRLRR